MEDLKKQLLESLEKDYPEYKGDVEIGNDANKSLETMFNKTIKGQVGFDLVYRDDENGGWLQVEYFSKLEKVLVLEYECPMDFNNLEDFVDWLIEKEEEMAYQEKQIVSIPQHNELKQAVKNLLEAIKDNSDGPNDQEGNWTPTVKLQYISEELETLKNLIK